MRNYVITLQSTPDRWARCEAHLKERGVDRVFRVDGMDAYMSGVTTTNTYEVDHPGSGYVMPPKHTGLMISHWLVWQLAKQAGEEIASVMEDDIVLAPDWIPRLHDALNRVPPDWDILLLGTCNALDKEKRHISGSVWDVKYPQCTHWYLVRQKALGELIARHQKIWAPIDLALYHDSYPHLKVYTVIPRLATQHEMEIAE